ncbi:MAG: hypothetical protein ACOC04_05355 [Halothece sp.]
MNHLIYPTLDLYTYDLRDGLGQNEEAIKESKESFYQKFSVAAPKGIKVYRPGNSDFKISQKDIIEDLKKRDGDSNIETEYLELLEYKRVFFDVQDVSRYYEGYYYPVLLNDLYGLLIDCTIHNKEGKSKEFPAKCFSALKSKIEERRNTEKKLNEQRRKLGETWFLTAQLPQFMAQSPQEIAQSCYEKLMPEASWKSNLRGTGYLYGGMLFELWGYHSPNQITSQHPKTKHHVIIALYPNEQAAKKAANLFFDWMRLFGYRSKILWAYGQALDLRDKLKKDFVKIQNFIDTIVKDKTPKQVNLRLFRTVLVEAQDTLASYSTNLSYLYDQIQTIEVNLYNYQRRLEEIKKNTESSPSSLILPNILAFMGQANDLTFLEEFSEVFGEKYLLQVQKDYSNFSPGLKLLDDLINSVRGITEIDQAERDRTFQAIVGVVGVGLGVGAAVASIAGHFPFVSEANQERALEHPFGIYLSRFVPDPWVAPSISLLVSLVAALFAGIVAGGVIGLVLLWQRRSPFRRK